MKETQHGRPVLYFDGVCNLCNRSVQFILKHDKKERFLLAPLQSPAGEEALIKANSTGKKTGSVILYYNSKYYTRSAAALYTLRLLAPPWNLLFSFIIIPPFIRNAIYDLIAANRYRWFGKQDTCMIPTPEIKKRFL